VSAGTRGLCLFSLRNISHGMSLLSGSGQYDLQSINGSISVSMIQIKALFRSTNSRFTHRPVLSMKPSWRIAFSGITSRIRASSTRVILLEAGSGGEEDANVGFNLLELGPSMVNFDR
jgi:hypothetical protein